MLPTQRMELRQVPVFDVIGPPQNLASLKAEREMRLLTALVLMSEVITSRVIAVEQYLRWRRFLSLEVSSSVTWTS